MTLKDLPIVCTLGPATLAARKANLLPTLGRRALRYEELPDGLRFHFSAEDLPAVAATIDQERRCCRFLQFEVRVEADRGPVCLGLTGPSGTREFLLAMIDG